MYLNPHVDLPLTEEAARAYAAADEQGQRDMAGRLLADHAVNFPHDFFAAHLIEISRLLDDLERVDARQCLVVELHFFSGFTFREIADILHLSERTVRDDWAVARMWLQTRLADRK